MAVSHRAYALNWVKRPAIGEAAFEGLCRLALEVHGFEAVSDTPLALLDNLSVPWRPDSGPLSDGHSHTRGDRRYELDMVERWLPSFRRQDDKGPAAAQAAPPGSAAAAGASASGQSHSSPSS
jgi:hypothetical protein